MKEKLIEKFKNIRKQGFLDLAESYKHKYAFIGVGAHSIMNLYPCISYQAIPLKYIVTKNGINAKKMAKRFQNCEGTCDISKVLLDDSVKGIFICTDPSVHYSLTSQCLEAGKNVFTEKPICTKFSEFKKLEQLCSNKNLICTVGLQKRYATTYNILKEKISNEKVTYNLYYRTGSYPEGNVIYELFVHPIDLIIYLFGPVKDFKVKKYTNFSGITYFLLLEHINGSQGIAELSTNYNWNEASEKIIINSKQGIFETENMKTLYYTEKPGVILGIPFEKIRKNITKKQILFENNNFMPIETYNHLKTHGYYDEIKNFVNAIEKENAVLLNELKNIEATWEFLHNLENYKE